MMLLPVLVSWQGQSKMDSDRISGFSSWFLCLNSCSPLGSFPGQCCWPCVWNPEHVLNDAAREKQDLLNQRKGSAIHLPAPSLLAAPRGLSQGKNQKDQEHMVAENTKGWYKGLGIYCPEEAQTESNTAPATVPQLLPQSHNSCPSATLLTITSNLMTKGENSKNNLNG